MSKRRQTSTEASCSFEELVLINLYDRPFLHEQGNTITRGFVSYLEVTGGCWSLSVRDVEVLDKTNGNWRQDEAEDEYGGHCDHSSAKRHWAGRLPVFDVGIDIHGYGLFIRIGRLSDNPWQDNDWPELDTDWLKPGPMSR